MGYVFNCGDRLCIYFTHCQPVTASVGSTIIISGSCSFFFFSDRVTLLASSVGVDSGSGSASGTPFPKAKVWQVTQKQKTVDDLVSVVINCQCQSLTSVFLRNRNDVIYGQKKCES